MGNQGDDLQDHGQMTAAKDMSTACSGLSDDVSLLLTEDRKLRADVEAREGH